MGEAISSIEIIDLFGLSAYGGSTALLCKWVIGSELVHRAEGLPARLASRVRDRTGRLLVELGSLSLPVSPDEGEHSVVLPLQIPAAPTTYEVMLDFVVEGKFWGSSLGVQLPVLAVQRSAQGTLLCKDASSGRQFGLNCIRRDRRFNFQIPHPLYGEGESERCVEIPWVLSRYRGERRVLDVGYAHAERRYFEALSALEIPILVGIDLAASVKADVRPLVADVRFPPVRRGSIDLVMAISVIEHIGRDNSSYQVGCNDSSDANGDFKAVRELAALLRHGGRLLLTLPFGVAEDHGWFIQYDEARLAALVGASGLTLMEADFYCYQGAWNGPVAPAELKGCRYGKGAPAAAGLACLTLCKVPAVLAPICRYIGSWRL